MIVSRIVLLGAGLCVAAFAQQPFYTDDTDLAERHHFHLEIRNQQNWLPPSALPATIQNTTVFNLNFGLTHNFEFGMDAPLILLYKQDQPVTVGQGDFNITFKWRVADEHSGSRAPAFTVACAIETPTGSVRKQTGSGIADYGCNSIIQKQLGLWTWRVNNGMVFSGNTLTGVVGLRGVKGFVYLGGMSFTKDVLPRLLLGAEVNGSVAQNGTALGKANLLAQFGGNFTMSPGFTLDFGMLRGWFSGAPRWQMQLGFSKDF